MSTTLKDLQAFIDDNLDKVIHRGIDCKYTDDKLQFKDDENLYDISPVAISELSAILHLPNKYIESIPSDLRTMNIMYFLMRFEGNLTFSISGNAISEVIESDNIRPVDSIISELSEVFDANEVNVIQPEIDNKHISMWIYFADEVATSKFGAFNQGYNLYIGTDKKDSVYCNPILVNPLEETAIEVLVDDDDEVDNSSITEKIEYVMLFKNVFDALNLASENRIEDINVFFNIMSSGFRMTSKAKKAVLEELQLSDASTISDAIKASLSAETRMKKLSDVKSIATFIGKYSEFKNPKFCSECGQPIIEDVNL
jgi:hypothetical protein